MEEGAEAKHGAAVAGVIAMVVGAILIAVAGSDGPVRPQVLGEALVATTTTTAPPAPPETTRAAPPTTRRGLAVRVGTPSTVPPPATTASTTAASTTTTEAPETGTTASPSTTEERAPCPSGTPVAEVRTWEAATDDTGGWSVIVSGAVINRTDATVVVDSVAIVVVRDDGSRDEVAIDERPTPYPPTIADGGESMWTWNGQLPPGAAPVGADATVVGWRWTDAPAHCTA